MSDTCLFCRIVRREIPAKIVAENESCVAFRDIDPKAPTHVLVVPRRHVSSLASATGQAELGDLLLLASTVARQLGVEESGYRVVLNTGDDGGQTVHHLHAHVLGGRKMTWPPG